MGICMTDYPEKSIRNIQTVADRLGVDFDTAYSMMMITATLMDMYPEDDAVVAMILPRHEDHVD